MEINAKGSNKKVTVLEYDSSLGEDNLHELWSTPVIISKPFTAEFHAQFKKDAHELAKTANKNFIDIWSLPDLPETFIKVRDKKLELAEKLIRKNAEMPLPPMRIAKGYFRHIKSGQYSITPHHHGSTLGSGIYYITLHDRNPGNLMIMDPRGGVNFTNQFSPFKRIKLEEGLMVITPGYLVHFVEPTDYHRPLYDERLLLVSNIHRTYEDWLKVLEEHDAVLTNMSSNPL